MIQNVRVILYVELTTVDLVFDQILTAVHQVYHIIIVCFYNNPSEMHCFIKSLKSNNYDLRYNF